MLQKGRTLVGALGLFGASVMSAEALDLCFDYSGGGSLVGKGFKIPPRNSCKPFNGFEVGGGHGLITGTGCTIADGDWFLLKYTYHDHILSFPLSTYFESGVCRVALPIEPGGNNADCEGTVISNGNVGNFSQNALFYRCTKLVPEPLP